MNEDVEVRHRTVLDSEVQQAGDVYAQALFGAVERTGAIDETLEELRALVEDVFAPQPKLTAFLESPRVEIPEKRRLIDAAFQGKVRKETLNLLRILADNRRIDSLGAVYASFRKLVQHLRREIEVSVVTAEPLTEELRDAVRNRLTASLGKKVHLRESVQGDLIGGLVVRVGDTVYDASLAGQFERIRDTALASARSQMRQTFERFAISEGQPS
ncbi:MAG TPA: ATP synthase F1 subunit delta [Pirellulaceae bacterium]|jgi:F-type H+-transporting ATPase subunit delta|nr:ATP synthase F1 subunit delta [Pirellulaceae bacterium]